MAIVRKDKLLAGYNGNLESVVLAQNVTNGVFVVLKGLVEGQRELRNAELATDPTVKEILLVHSDEVMYDEKKKVREFINEAGKACRAYRLFDGDIITFTVDLFNGVPAVGEKCVVGTDGKLTVTEDVSTAKVVFEIIEDCGYELGVEEDDYSYAVQVAIQ